MGETGGACGGHGFTQRNTIEKEEIFRSIPCNCCKKGKKEIQYVRISAEDHPDRYFLKCSLGMPVEKCSVLYLYHSIIHQKKSLF